MLLLILPIYLRVSPPPSAPTVHPAGPGGGCSDAAPTGPRAARPGLPAPGTHRVPASPRLPGSAGRQARKERRRGGLPLPRREPPPELRLSAVLSGAGPAPLPRPGSHFGSGGPVAITAQQLTRRRSGAGEVSAETGGRPGGTRRSAGVRGSSEGDQQCERSAPGLREQGDTAAAAAAAAGRAQGTPPLLELCFSPALLPRGLCGLACVTCHDV